MNNTQNVDLVGFIDSVLSPMESFARMCLDSNDNLFIPNLPKAGLNEVGMVTGALVTLSRIQLREVAEKLQSNAGEVEITRDMNDFNSGDVYAVGLASKTK